jgi:hypothetical protein
MSNPETHPPRVLDGGSTTIGALFLSSTAITEEIYFVLVDIRNCSACTVMELEMSLHASFYLMVIFL